MKAIRFPYNRVEPGQSATSELAYLPITLSTSTDSIQLQGLLY